MDVLSPMFVYVVLGFILEGRFWFLWLAPPCGTFSMAYHKLVTTMLRQVRHVEGLPWLRGSGLRDVALTFAGAQNSVDETVALEQPGSSMTLDSGPYQSMEKKTKPAIAYRDQCRDGALWRKSTCITSNDFRVVAINGSCPGCRSTCCTKDGTGATLRRRRSRFHKIPWILRVSSLPSASKKKRRGPGHEC